MTVTPLLTPAEAAVLLGVARDTLRNWRHQGFGPAYVKVGGRVRYRPSDIERWAAEHLIEPEAERP